MTMTVMVASDQEIRQAYRRMTEANARTDTASADYAQWTRGGHTRSIDDIRAKGREGEWWQGEAIRWASTLAALVATRQHIELIHGHHREGL